MNELGNWNRRKVLAGLAVSGLMTTRSLSATRGVMVRGCNLVETAEAPFGSDAAMRSFVRLAETGANSVALIPFLWQSGPHSPNIVLGDALPPSRLARGLEQASAAGLSTIVKPHVWVPEGWAGQIAMTNPAAWTQWFAGYREALLPLARVAAAGGAREFVVGTETRQTVARPEWRDLIDEVRAVFPGRLTFVAHGAEGAERVTFWDRLDAVGVSLYPVLGTDRDKGAWHRAMHRELSRVQAVADRAGLPIWIGEIGIRSATGAAAKPWESAEERDAAPDPELQAHVIGAWLHELEKLDPAAVLVWRWFSDPDAGGRTDTDFTIQSKPAADVLRAAWLRT